jgi:hypothetical protein
VSTKPLATGSATRIRPASFEDYPGIARLLEKYKLDAKPADEWAQLWEGNPAFDADRWAIGWIMEHARDGIVGYAGNVPLVYEFRGARLTAAATHAWVVEAAYRRSTFALVHRYFGQKDVDLLINASANYQAGRIFEAMHGHQVPSPHADTALFWISDGPGFASSFMRQKGLPASVILRHVLSGLTWGRGLVATRGRHRWDAAAWPEERVVSLSRFDERFDDFWDRLRAPGDLILCVRDSRTLTWHFRPALAKDLVWIYAVPDGSRISAYAVFLRQDNAAVGLRRVRLVDFRALAGHEQCLGWVMSAALARCREESVHMLECVGFGGQTRSLLEAHAPYRRRLPACMFFYKAGDRQLNQDLTSAAHWDVCPYDGDGSL